MKMKRCILGFVLTVLLAVQPSFAQVRLPSIFSDHMVLQQSSEVPVWGWATPSQKISVKGSWAPNDATSAVAAVDGIWRLKINTPKAGGPYRVVVRGTNKIVLEDILIGEVWICSGQSNMEMGMMAVDNAAEEIAKANYPSIRLFDVAQAISTVPLRDVTGHWVKCSQETVKNLGTWGGFSATAYYFGRKLHDELNIPIGLVTTNWGGTPAEAWTSSDKLETFERFTDTLKIMKNPEKRKKVYRQKYLDWENKIDQIDPGYQQGWYKPDTDDDDWKEMELPLQWAGTEMESFDGIVWFCRTTNLPSSWASTDLELHMGPIDDIDTLWFNGVKVGTTARWEKPRVYRIPASVLNVGKNFIAVRIIDTGRRGGVFGNKEDMRIGPVGADVRTCQSLAKTWKYKIGLNTRKIPSFPEENDDNPRRPTVLYNGMLAPLTPFRIAGVIWYQGESNRLYPVEYRTLFPAMINDWRTHWEQGDFPFYYVQIAPFEYYGNPDAADSAFLREAQMLTLDRLPNLGMAVTMDIGEENDIHPHNKLDVGERLARWALAKTYGQKNIVYSGPIYRSMCIEKDSIRLSFYYVGSGLIARNDPLTDFEIAGEDQKFVPAKARIDGETIVVSAAEVSAPVAVRYAFKNWAQPNLYNVEGLPASSFRTDDWPVIR